MKKLIALLLAVLLLLSMAACATKEEPDADSPATDTPATDAPASGSETNAEADAPAAEEPVTITWGVYETDNLTAEVWDSVIAMFEEANPGIKVEKVVAVGDSRPSFWMTMAASGTFPDIVLEAEQMAKLEPTMFAELPADVADLFEEGAMTSFGGKNVTIPFMKQLRMQCYYNKADFEELGLSEPGTYDEFLDICATLKEAGKTPLICGGTGDVWATGQPWWISVTNQEIVSAYPDFISQVNSGELTWLDPVIVESMEDWKALIDAGYYHPGCMSWSYAQAAAEFQNGGATMMIDGSWAAAGFDAAGDDRFGVFIVPNKHGIEGYCCPVSYWGVSAQSKNEEAAWTFVRWFFSTPEAYCTLLQADGLNSTTKQAVTYEQGPVMTKFVQNLEGKTLYPEIVKVVGDNMLPGGVENATCTAMQLIFTGMDVEEALQTVQDAQDMG